MKAKDVVWSKGRYDRNAQSKSDIMKNKMFKSKFTPMSKQQCDESNNENKMRSELYCLLKYDIRDSSLTLTMEKRKIKAPTKPIFPPTVIHVTTKMSPSATKESVVEKLKISHVEINILKQETVLQSVSETWKEHRKGRITASLFHRVSTHVNTLRRTESALVDTIIGQKHSKQTVAMKHGLALEPCAKKRYSAIMKKSHKKFNSSDSGLTVYMAYPYLASSADLEIECLCCGQGVCEIKCPENIKDQSPSVKNVMNVTMENNVICLDKNHPYYFQVQGQMKILDRKYSDFFIFTLHGHLRFRITFDEEFWNSLEEN